MCDERPVAAPTVVWRIVVGVAGNAGRALGGKPSVTARRSPNMLAPRTVTGLAFDPIQRSPTPRAKAARMTKTGHVTAQAAWVCAALGLLQSVKAVRMRRATPGRGRVRVTRRTDSDAHIEGLSPIDTKERRQRAGAWMHHRPAPRRIPNPPRRRHGGRIVGSGRRWLGKGGWPLHAAPQQPGDHVRSLPEEMRSPPSTPASPHCATFGAPRPGLWPHDRGDAQAVWRIETSLLGLNRRSQPSTSRPCRSVIFVQSAGLPCQQSTSPARPALQ